VTGNPDLPSSRRPKHHNPQCEPHASVLISKNANVEFSILLLPNKLIDYWTLEDTNCGQKREQYKLPISEKNTNW